MIRSGEDGDLSTTGNRYCERVGLTSVPRVQGVLGLGEVNLFHLMVVALLERGGPMTVDEIAERLTGTGAIAGRGDMVLSLKRAWHEGAKGAGALVDLVVGSAPGWADSWSRARRGAILEVGPWQVTVRLDGEVWRLDRRDIQAVRVVGEADDT